MKDLQRKKQVYADADNAYLIQETEAQTDSIARLQTENRQAISQLKVK